MASCLGLYIESNTIKYAKVSKGRDNLKVEAFGIEFYEDINQTIEQIVEETDSYKTPISINLSEEMYTYFDVFSLLGKNYLPKVIKTEFESYCVEKGYNPNVFETRYALVDEAGDNEKIRVINISANKLELEREIAPLNSYKLTTVSPVSMAITNIIELGEKEDAIIVNMEENTILTTISNQKIYSVDIIEEGSSDVLNKINLKENSYSKAYEACKNTTIYTADYQDLGSEQNYLDDIIPTLNKIISHLKDNIGTSLVKVKKIYLTGSLTCINNIDLYFQEYLPEVECEILKPYFVDTTGNEISIKDYIEVNSAIALGAQGLGFGVTGMNFKKTNFSDMLKMEVGGASKTQFSLKDLTTPDLSEPSTQGEKKLIRVALGLLLIILIYSVLSSFLYSQMQRKGRQVEEVTAQIQEQVNLAKSDKDKIDTKTNEFKSMTQALEDLSDRTSDINKSKNVIPNLLNQIMFVIPENVQIISIENTTDKHIVIVAQANKYEQLGYFKVKLKSDGILNNVVSDSGVAAGDAIKVTIEGDLP